MAGGVNDAVVDRAVGALLGLAVGDAVGTTLEFSSRDTQPTLTDTFGDAILLAANLADDADTVAAITGQLAGALYGASAIPARWRAKLAWHDEIESLAQRLLARGGAT